MSRARHGMDENYPAPVAPLDPETRDTARRVLEALDAADLFPMLGLDEENEPAVEPGCCKQCGKPLPMARVSVRAKRNFTGYCNAQCAGAAGQAKARANARAVATTPTA
jgi:hypothetical protein